jgi:hypothetical protein
MNTNESAVLNETNLSSAHFWYLFCMPLDDDPVGDVKFILNGSRGIDGVPGDII